MNAIRTIVKRDGNVLKIILPEDFQAEEFEVIVLPSDAEMKMKENGDEELKSLYKISSEGLSKAYDDEDDSFDNLKVMEPNPKYSK